jgi:phosphatidylserine/phosphatidylglycerophosphate/cardiolipin synthase-like enzyme
MEESEVTARLVALHKAVGRRLENIWASSFDPPTVLEYFERWVSVRDALKTEHPELLADLPNREVPESSGTTAFDGRWYIKREQVGQLFDDMQYVLDVLAALPSVAVPSMRVTREGVFFAGQYFDALREVSELISGAQRSIVLVDGYVSVDTLSVLSTNSSGITVRILTKDAPSAFRTAAQAFAKQFGSLEVRLSQAFHDRFLVIDGHDLYHLGASIKDLGHRGFMFSRVEEPEVLTALTDKVKQEWQAAQVVL